MELQRKHLMDKFLHHIIHSYESWCGLHDVPFAEDRLLTFLIDQELIPSTNILRFTVLQEMKHLSKDSTFQKTHNVGLLAGRFNLSERTIWNILKQANTPNAKQRLNPYHQK